MKQTFIELQRPIIIYPFLELWYFNIQLVKLLSILATKHLFILLALSLLFLRWQEAEEEAPLLIGSSRKWELNVPGLLSPAAEERSVWTPSRTLTGLRNLSPQPVPLIYAFQEPANFLSIAFPVPWGSTGESRRHHSELTTVWIFHLKRALWFWKLQKTIIAWFCSAPASPRWMYVQQGQKYFMYTSSPESSKHKYTQVEHRSPCRLTKQDDVSWLCIPHERKHPSMFCAVLPDSFNNRTELQNSEQNLDFPSSTHGPGPNLQQN